LSIETQLSELTAAIKDLTVITTKLHDMRADMIEKVTTAAAATPKKKDEPKGDEAKPNISASPEVRKDPNDTSTGAGGANPYEGIKELIADYIKSGSDREEERAARKDWVRKLLNHEKIKKPEIDEPKSAEHIMESAIQLFKDQIAKKKALGDITQPPKKSGDDLEL
jgi:hypothetical protein